MDRVAAEQLQMMALTVQARMRETLEFTRDNGDDVEFERVKLATGRVLAALIDGILQPIQAAHPELVPQGMRGPYVIDLERLGPSMYRILSPEE